MATVEELQQEQSGLVEEKFFFRPKKKDGVEIEPKRDELVVKIPAVSKESLLNTVFDELTEDSEGNTVTTDRGDKLLEYLARLHNAVVYSEAQSQINDALSKAGPDGSEKKINYVLSQSDIDLTKLDLWVLVYKEPVGRGGGKKFSDELVAAVNASFIEFGIANFKDSKGQSLDKEIVMNTAKEIFLDRFKNTKTMEKVLEMFQERITLWFDQLSDEQQEAWQEFAKYLLDRIENYLNPDESSIMGKFGF